MDNERLTTKERLLEVWPLLASAREFAARDGRQTLSTLDLMLAAVERSDLRENVEMFFDVYLDTDFILSRIERVSHVGRLTGAQFSQASTGHVHPPNHNVNGQRHTPWLSV